MTDDETHRYSRRKNSVYVGPAGAATLTAYDLDDHDDEFDVTAWVAFVDGVRGWTECRYVRDWADHVADAVEVEV